jgi:hypothetical protein
MAATEEERLLNALDWVVLFAAVIALTLLYLDLRTPPAPGDPQ